MCGCCDYVTIMHQYHACNWLYSSSRIVSPLFRTNVTSLAARKNFRVIHCAALILPDLIFSAKRSSSSLFKLQITNRKFASHASLNSLRTRMCTHDARVCMGAYVQICYTHRCCMPSGCAITEGSARLQPTLFDAFQTKTRCIFKQKSTGTIANSLAATTLPQRLIMFTAILFSTLRSYAGLPTAIPRRKETREGRPLQHISCKRWYRPHVIVASSERCH